MPLLVQRAAPVSAGSTTCGCAAPPEAAEPADGLLFDDLVLGGGDGGGGGVKNAPDADNGSDEWTAKLEWLRSQIIGVDAEFTSPFGARRITYADHTASGRCLRFVEDFVQRNVLPYYGNTHTEDSYVGLHTSRLAAEATRYVKRSLGAGPEDMLLFCGTGCTAAIKRLQEVTGMAVPPTLRAAALAALPPVERWVVFVGPYEHHSNLLTWRESLAEVVEVPLRPADGLPDLDALEAALEAFASKGSGPRRPMLGAFSACSNVTGVRTDTRAVARLLHRHGAYACFDFACSAPYVRVDMRGGGGDGGDDGGHYDAVFLSPHKFLGGPGAPGVLAMSSRLYRLARAPPSTSGGGTVLYVSAYGDTVYSGDAEEREDAGTPAIIQKVRAALAFRVKAWVGEACVGAREARMLALALRRLRAVANPALRLLLGGAGDAPRLPVLSFVVYGPGPRGDGEAGSEEPRLQLHCRFVTKLLNDLFGVQARAGCACAGPYGHRLLGIGPARAKAIKSAVEQGYHGVRPGWTRVSLAYYTSTREAEFVLDAVDFVATFGHRFLPLYAFDWRTGGWHYNSNSCAASGLVPNSGGAGAAAAPGGRVNAESDYQGYMTFASRLADSLTAAPCTGQASDRSRRVPDGIDPQLVYFVV